MNSNKSVAVIGAGISGLQAAIELADCGLQVYLIENKAFAGGNVHRLYKMFPTDDCAFCTVSTLLKPGIRKCFYRAGVTKHPRIHLLTNCEVNNVEGSKGNFKVTITQRPRYVSFNCTRCGKCEESCPVVISPIKWNEFQRKAIYLPARMCIPSTYIIDREKCEPDCTKCAEACPFDGVINLDEQSKELELNVGAIILATGINEFDPSPLINLKYGRYENVITQLELAQMLDFNGPTGGKLVRPSDKAPVQSLVMIQCVGSRDIDYKKYCSTICCSYACKHARIVKGERNHDINLHIIYTDVRTFGVLEKYYRDCRKLGIDFLRGRIGEIFQEPDGRLRIEAVDTLLQRTIELVVDLVVLTPALISSEESREIFGRFGIETDADGFINSKVGDKSLTNIEGIYVCGTAVSPMDFPNSITLAKAAACNVLKQFIGGKSSS